jgi:hypothetical protein
VIGALLLLLALLFRVHAQDSTRAWEARCSWLTCITCGLSHHHSASLAGQAGAEAAGSEHAPLRKVALLMAATLDTLHLTLSDMSLAMLLVGVWHRTAARPQQLWRSKSRALQPAAEGTPLAATAAAAAGAAVALGTPVAGAAEAGSAAGGEEEAGCRSISIHASPQEHSIHIQQQQGQQWEQQQQQQKGEEEEGEEEEVAPEVLQQAAHFMQFSLGVYGWMMHVWANRRNHRCCSTCFGRACGCCCRHDDYTSAAAEQLRAASSAAQLPRRLSRYWALGERLTREAIQQTAGLEDSQLLYVNYTNVLQGARRRPLPAPPRGRPRPHRGSPPPCRLRGRWPCSAGRSSPAACTGSLLCAGPCGAACRAWSRRAGSRC